MRSPDVDKDAMSGSSDAVICTAADAGFYLGLAALVNSLHLTGHADVSVVCVDGGLTHGQRATLEPFVTFVPAPRAATRGTMLVKADVAALGVEGVVLVIDADCIVTGSLRPIFQLAASGRVCAARDDAPAGSERRFAEWESLFALRSSVRDDGTYVNTGAVCVSTEHWPELLPRWAQITRWLPRGHYLRGQSDTNPIWAADQDVLNAILMSELPASALAVLPRGTMAYAQWRDARITSMQDVGASVGGRESTFVHFSLAPKPWTTVGWKRVGREPLLPLLARCLVGEDLPVRVDSAEVPWWLTPGATADARRTIVAARNAVSHTVSAALWGAYGRLPAPSQHVLRSIRGREVATMEEATVPVVVSSTLGDQPHTEILANPAHRG